ncbi:hypothetical protein SAMN05428952_10027 [Nitrosomonas sp. Nm132]|nr:hypothetical protein SAMN05428952_10027 [Nitrosomonas sp. Nm132]
MLLYKEISTFTFFKLNLIDCHLPLEVWLHDAIIRLTDQEEQHSVLPFFEINRYDNKK